MEEIGYRTEIFTLDGIAGSQREYIQWLLTVCLAQEEGDTPILTEEAIDLLATKLRTPLQVQQHITLALEAGYLTGERPITAELVDSILSRKLDDLEPTLTRHGYRLKDMVEQFDAKPGRNQGAVQSPVGPDAYSRTADRILAAGLPI
ncbi:AAA ATPase [Enterobacter cancerogenus]|uniref:AAA ATPase n=1 Tax=Enterobacter cancerogenus TaxID=69218 RepID=A0A484XCX3_9ENTR|nr:AAA ATPase [Enterobacter cancerogenus]